MTPEERVKQWRDWAIFVFQIKDGAAMTDVELQKQVCKIYDADISSARYEAGDDDI